MSKVDFSKVRPGNPGFFLTRESGKGEKYPGDELSITKVVSDGSGGLWVCSSEGGVRLADAETSMSFLSEVSVQEAEEPVINTGKRMVVDLLESTLGEGWPVFSRQGWAKSRGYIEDGVLTKEGRLLYQEIADVIKGLDASAKMPSIDDLA